MTFVNKKDCGKKIYTIHLSYVDFYSKSKILDKSSVTSYMRIRLNRGSKCCRRRPIKSVDRCGGFVERQLRKEDRRSPLVSTRFSRTKLNEIFNEICRCV